MNEYEKNKVDLLWTKLTLYPKYIKQLNYFRREIEHCHIKFLEAGEVSGIRYDKETSQNGTDIASIYNEILSDEQRMKEKCREIEKKIKELERIRDDCTQEAKEIIQFKFFDGNTWEDAEYKFFKTKKALDYQIRKSLLNVEV